MFTGGCLTKRTFKSIRTYWKVGLWSSKAQINEQKTRAQLLAQAQNNSHRYRVNNGNVFCVKHQHASRCNARGVSRWTGCCCRRGISSRTLCHAPQTFAAIFPDQPVRSVALGLFPRPSLSGFFGLRWAQTASPILPRKRVEFFQVPEGTWLLQCEKNLPLCTTGQWARDGSASRSTDDAFSFFFFLFLYYYYVPFLKYISPFFLPTASRTLCIKFWRLFSLFSSCYFYPVCKQDVGDVGNDKNKVLNVFDILIL